MSSKVQKLPGEPITIYTAPENADLDDLPAASRLLTDVLDQQQEPVYHIANMLGVRLLDPEGLRTLAMNAVLGKEALFRHPMIKEVIIVSSDPALLMTAEALDTALSPFRIRVFRSLDEALKYARSQIKLSTE